YTVDKNCRKHAPWPAASCLSCLPKSITLEHQKFRHIDYLSFCNSSIVEKFLDRWRKTGDQIVGFLIGNVVKHNANRFTTQINVHFIYEPKQIGSLNFVEILKEPEEDLSLMYLLEQTGLEIVGMDTYTITSEESIMAAHYQLNHPFKIELSPTGKFGSCFTSLCITGDEEGKIKFIAFQSTIQCMNLVEAGIVFPTKDAPDLATIRDSDGIFRLPLIFAKNYFITIKLE
ncbi:MAG: Nuclear protein localization protein 4, partial [Paramarteilia canceri]